MEDCWWSGDPQELFEAMAELLDLARRPPWHASAACHGVGPEVMFPGRGEQATEARALCARCPVIDACAVAGRGEAYGIWGGEGAAARRIAGRQAA